MDQQPMMQAAVQLWTIRWVARARTQLRAEAARLGFDLADARLRADMAEGRLVGTRPGLTFWYYPHGGPPGTLYLVRQCPICRHPFPLKVETLADLAAFWTTPLPECHPDPWSWERLRHWLHAQRQGAA